MFAVAGVSGQTGAAVARALLAAGESVRVIVRRVEAGVEWASRGAEIAAADLADASALTAALTGADGAYLLNPPAYGSQDPIGAGARLGEVYADAIRASRVERVVMLSSVGAHLANGNGIIGSVNRVEQALSHVKAAIAIVRAQYFFENWTHVLQPVRDNGVLPTFLGPADKRFPTVPVADIAAQVVALLRGPAWTGRRVVELASFEASPGEVAQALAAELGRPVSPVLVPHDQWSAILGRNGFSPAVVEKFVEMYDGLNSGHIAPERGVERVVGATTLREAARALVG